MINLHLTKITKLFYLENLELYGTLKVLLNDKISHSYILGEGSAGVAG